MAPDIDVTNVLDLSALEKLETPHLNELYAQIQSAEKDSFISALKKLIVLDKDIGEETENEKQQAVEESAAKLLLFTRTVLKCHEENRCAVLVAENTQLRQENQQLKDTNAAAATTTAKRSDRDAASRRARERSSSPYYKEEILRLEKQIDTQDVEIKSRDRQVAQLKADNAELDAKFGRVTRENQSLQAEIDDLNSDIRHLNRRLDSSIADEAPVASKRRRATPVRRAYSSTNSSVNRVINESNSVRAATTAILEQKLDNQDRHLTRALGDARLLSEQNESMQAQIQELQHELDEALQYLQDANDEIESQQHRLHEMEQKFCTSTQAQIFAVQAQIERRHERISNGVPQSNPEDTLVGAALPKDENTAESVSALVKTMTNKADSLARIVEKQQHNDESAQMSEKPNYDAESLPPVQERRDAYEKLLKTLQIDINNHEFNIESAAVTYLRQILSDKNEQINALHSELMSASSELQNAVMLIEAMKISLQQNQSATFNPVSSSADTTLAARKISLLEKELETARLQLKPLEQDLQDAQDQLATNTDLGRIAQLEEIKKLRREMKNKNQQMSVLLKRLSQTEAELQIMQDENDRIREISGVHEELTEILPSSVHDNQPVARNRQSRRERGKHISFNRHAPSKKNRSTSAESVLHASDDVSSDENNNDRQITLRRSKSSTQVSESGARQRKRRVIHQPPADVAEDFATNNNEQNKLNSALNYEIAQLEGERLQLQNIIRKFAHASRVNNNVHNAQLSQNDDDRRTVQKRSIISVEEKQPVFRVRAPLRQLLSKADVERRATTAGGSGDSVSTDTSNNETVAGGMVERERRRNRQLLADNYKLEECLQDTLQALRLFNTTNANNPLQSQLRLPGYVRSTFTGIIGTLNEQLLSCLNDMLAQRQALIEFRKNIGDLRHRLSAQIVERQVLLKRCVKAEGDAAEVRRDARINERAHKEERQARQALQDEYDRLLDTIDTKTDNEEVKRRMVETERRLIVTLSEQQAERAVLHETRSEMASLKTENHALRTNMATIESQILPLVHHLSRNAAIDQQLRLSSITPQPNFDAENVNSNNNIIISSNSLTNSDADSVSGSGNTTINNSTSTGDVTKTHHQQQLFMRNMLFAGKLQPRRNEHDHLNRAQTASPQMLEDGEIVPTPLVEEAHAAFGFKNAAAAVEPGEADSGIITASSIGTSSAAFAVADELRTANNKLLKNIDRLTKQLASRDELIKRLRHENQELLAEVKRYSSKIASDLAVETEHQQPAQLSIATIKTVAIEEQQPPVKAARRRASADLHSTDAEIRADQPGSVEKAAPAGRQRSASSSRQTNVSNLSIEKRISALLSKNTAGEKTKQNIAATINDNKIVEAHEQNDSLHAFTQTTAIDNKVAPPPVSVLEAFNAQLALKQEQILDQSDIITNLNSALEAAKSAHIVELRRFEQRFAERDAERQNELGALKLHALQQHDTAADSVDALQRHIKDLEVRLAHQNLTIDAKLSAYNDLERLAESYRRDNEALRGLLAEMRTNTTNQDRQVGHLQAELENVRAALKRERDDSDHLRRDNAEVNEQIKRLRVEKPGNEKPSNNGSIAHTTASNQSDITDALHANFHQQIETLKTEVDKKTKIIHRLNKKIKTGLMRQLTASAIASDDTQLKPLQKNSGTNKSSPALNNVVDSDVEVGNDLHTQQNNNSVRKPRPVSAATTSAAAGGDFDSMRGGNLKVQQQQQRAVSSCVQSLYSFKSSTSIANTNADRLRLQALYKQTQKSDTAIENLQQENTVLKRKLTHAESEVKKFKNMLELQETMPPAGGSSTAVVQRVTENVIVSYAVQTESNDEQQQLSAMVADLQQQVRLLQYQLKQQEAFSEQIEKKRVQLEKNEQVIRWDESKKWQQQVEKLRAKTKQLQQQLDDTERRDKMLRASLDRATSERAALAAELERTQKRLLAQNPIATPASAALQPNGTQKINQLSNEIRRLKRELADQKSKSSEHVRNLQATRKLEDELKGLNATLQKENCSLASLVDKTRQEIEALRMRCEHLQNESEQVAAASSSSGGAGQSAPGNVNTMQDAGTLRQRNAELERAIGLLKPVVESLQRERNQLRDQLKQQRERLRQLETARGENVNLQTELTRLRAAEINPEYQHSLKRVLGENDTLIDELRHEKARADRLQSRLVALDSQRKLLVQRNNELNERVRLHANTGGGAAGGTQSTTHGPSTKNTARLSMAYQALEKKIEDLEEEVEKWKFKANMHEQQSAIRKSLAGYTDADADDESRRVRTYEDVLNHNIRLRTQAQLLQQEMQDKDRLIAELHEQVKDYDPGMSQNFRLLQKHHSKTIEEMTRLKVQIDVLKKDQAQLHQALGRKGIH